MRLYASLEDALELGTGRERQFICHIHDDHNASASVNSVTGAWLCYACGARGKVDVDSIEVSTDTVVREMRWLNEMFTAEKVERTESWLNLFDATGPGEYWLSRYLPQTCKGYRLGFDPATSAAIYPLRSNNGHVLGVVRRSLLAEGPKYLYPAGVDMSTLIFDLHRCVGDVIFLVEGATDAIAAREAGFEAMALYGSRLSRAQAALLRAYQPGRIISAFDQDRAGDQAHESVRKQFGVMVERARWDTYKDLSEAPLEDRRLILAQSLDGRHWSKVASTTCESSARTQQQLSNSSKTSGRQKRVRLTPTPA